MGAGHVGKHLDECGEAWIVGGGRGGGGEGMFQQERGELRRMKRSDGSQRERGGGRKRWGDKKTR